MPARAFEHRDELAFEGLCAQSQECLFPVAIYKSYLNSICWQSTKVPAYTFRS